MMTNVVPLRPIERVFQDAEPIAVVYRNLGSSAAEAVVTRALTDLALTMSGLTQQVRAHDLHDLAARLHKLQRTADHLGMVTMATVAGDVRDCIEAGNVTAFSAVWARLCRVAESSLSPDGGLLDGTL
jgi:hypothetical protein